MAKVKTPSGKKNIITITSVDQWERLRDKIDDLAVDSYDSIEIELTQTSLKNHDDDTIHVHITGETIPDPVEINEEFEV